MLSYIKIIELIVQTPSTGTFLYKNLNLQATNDDSYHNYAKPGPGFSKPYIMVFKDNF
jgi:hypothetical protein